MPDLADPRWFPVDLHVPDKRFGMLQLDEELIGRSSFLDTRLEAPLDEAVPALVNGVAVAKLPRAPVGWLFHTSFCASTLLARALHLPPHTVALKEPLVLRRLSDARSKRWSLEGLLAPTVKLLARPWHAGGAVVIKPTHVALNLAADLVAAVPGSRAVLLTSSLDDFLISNIKKPTESQAKVPLLVERALQATTFATRLPQSASRPPDPVSAAGLQWAAQREHVVDLLDGIGAERIRALDAKDLLADIVGTTAAVAAWLQLPLPREALAAHTAEVAKLNAKAPGASYSAEQRAHEAAHLASSYAAELARAKAWLDEHVLPAMRDTAKASPASWI